MIAAAAALWALSVPEPPPLPPDPGTVPAARPSPPVPAVRPSPPPVPRTPPASVPASRTVAPAAGPTPPAAASHARSVDAPASPVPASGAPERAAPDRAVGAPVAAAASVARGIRPATEADLARDRAVLQPPSARGASARTQPPPARPVARRTALAPLPVLRARGRRPPPARSAVFVVGYRVFTIHDRLRRSQSWHFASVEAGLLRRYVRLGLLTEVGAEGGEAARGDRNDFMVVQKVGLGAQVPHFVTPFVEVQGGVGLVRTELFERNDLGWVATVGVEGGAQWAVARFFRIHLAAGWIRPYLKDAAGVRRADSFTFRVGLGF